jgi:glycosyltransferase involved in cell wall biosynthesis
MTHEEIMDIRKHNYKGRERSQEGMIVLADKVVTISQVHKDAFDKIYPEFKNKSVCIPNGTDMELYADFIDVHRMAQQLRQQIAPNGERVVIYTGRVEVQKGAIPLFKGINAIAEKYQDVKFVLIGSNPDIEDKLLSFGLNPIFKNKIHYTGWIKDRKVLAAYYKLADVMVQPVFSKNLYAMVALEAMILKVPVVSCPGELTIGTCESAESILKAVDLVFINKEAVKRHVEHVRGVVMQDYSLTAVYKKHIELYANARKISSSKRLVA